MTGFSSFDETVRRFAQDQKQQMDRIRRESIKALAAEANEPVSEGGNMRVDTGFLRASQTASTSSQPLPNPAFDRDRLMTYTYYPERVNVVVDNSEWGDTVYIGWTAKYAGIREHLDGFMRLAVQNWRAIVEREAKKRYKGGKPR